MATVQIRITGRYRDEVERACRELETQTGTRLQWDGLPTRDPQGGWQVTGVLLLPPQPSAAARVDSTAHRRIILA